MRNIVVSAGPARVPIEVRDAVIRRIGNDQPCSLLELTDRSLSGREMLDEAHSEVRRILKVPENFTCLLLPGGGSQQFAIAAMNARLVTHRMDFIVTDHWTSRAMQEFRNFIPVRPLDADTTLSSIPLVGAIPMSSDGAGVFLTSNNTAAGTQWPTIPTLPSGCRIVDMSSDLFARLPNYTGVDIVLACAQKNFGVAGISLVVVSKEKLLKMKGANQSVFSYQSWLDSGGMYNTFPMLPLAVTVEYLRYISLLGGVDGVLERCKKCSDPLYEYLQNSKLFQPSAQAEFRSPHNVTFKLLQPSKNAEEDVLKRAQSHGVLGLKGHSSIGGFRASFYTGSDPTDAANLIAFLKDLEMQQLYSR